MVEWKAAAKPRRQAPNHHDIEKKHVSTAMNAAVSFDFDEQVVIYERIDRQEK